MQRAERIAEVFEQLVCKEINYRLTYQDCWSALERLRGVYAPRAAILPLDVSRSAEFPTFLADLVEQDGLPTAYVCRGARCDLPTTDIGVAVDALRK